MGKSHVQRQKECRECLKEKSPEMYLKKDWDRKKTEQEALKKTTKCKDCKAKDKVRKRKQKS